MLIYGYATGYQHAQRTRSALDAFKEGQGVCRDYAHLAITLCRCLCTTACLRRFIPQANNFLSKKFLSFPNALYNATRSSGSSKARISACAAFARGRTLT
ncbi:transglutaminase family protein [Variovorax sp. YR216]|uniref:transglutaminase-like domain-containing protein n=1 Tax=Variovorax sp. YR216 TaxID=1882828 RepID=UPI00210B3C27|nr:transglutaminase domain-containing protein [Variovorax sp. YR216]